MTTFHDGRKVRLKPLTENTSLRIVENKSLLCKTCILGEEIRSNTVLCNLNPEQREVKATGFCGQGVWVIDGEIMDFKEAWSHINKEDKC